ncbi:MAG: phospholipid scramblase-related protein [Planctomycetaceae bacterium]
MLGRTSYFIREHVGLLKLSDTYDILDPESQEQLGVVREKPGTLIHILRFLINKRMLPTKIFIYEGDSYEDDSKLVFSIVRGMTFLRAKVDIRDADGNTLGWFKSKLFSLGGGFHVYNNEGEAVAHIKGDWKGWNFRLLDHSDNELGTVTKKWSGLGKELFTSADNYIISLNEEPTAALAVLLLAAGLAIDTVFKER